MAANDKIADLFAAHAIDLLRVEAGQRKAVTRLLTDLEADLVAQLARIDPTTVSRQSARVARLEKLLDQVRGSIRSVYRDASTLLAGELRELADIEVAFTARAINEGLGLQLATATITRAQATALVGDLLVQGAPVADWWSRQAGDTLQRFQDAMRLGMSQGDTSAQLIQRIRGGRRNGEVVQGFMDISRRNADTLVRSATQAASAAAKDVAYSDNADILKGIVWMATLDGRTTIGCGARDGLLYTVGTHEPIDHDLPWEGGPGNRHFGCRSTSAPVTKSFRELGLDIDDLPAATRASIDGQLPSDTKFEGWLSRQSRARQEQVLGEGRAELFREGKIGLRDLLDGNGRELSLEELRARI